MSDAGGEFAREWRRGGRVAELLAVEDEVSKLTRAPKIQLGYARADTCGSQGGLSVPKKEDALMCVQKIPHHYYADRAKGRKEL